ncbi:RidA family protein [Crassaminicella profunda]|uniref:RidA family protein n=1 Tax=Crassaminicella profunda TaxID=1286698 RepID=UPI001CA6D32A|nr:RidA family protein [Crassaminicella profunda]QZY54821.1 RidA family protein [Crassaminicella profunda]
MSKEMIATTKAPAAIGPYSQGVKAGGMLFISGQLPINPETGEMPEKVADQTKQSLENAKNILMEAGLSMDAVVKTTVFLKDLNNFTAMNEVYGQYFQNGYPARSAVQVARLPKDAEVEIEVIAEI